MGYLKYIYTLHLVLPTTAFQKTASTLALTLCTKQANQRVLLYASTHKATRISLSDLFVFCLFTLHLENQNGTLILVCARVARRTKCIRLKNILNIDDLTHTCAVFLSQARTFRGIMFDHFVVRFKRLFITYINHSFDSIHNNLPGNFKYTSPYPLFRIGKIVQFYIRQYS